MPKIALLRDPSIQTQCAVGLNPNHWLYKDIVFAYSESRGRQDGAHWTGAAVGSLTYGSGPSGRFVRPADGSSYVEFPNHDDYNVLGDITVIASIRTAGLTVQQAVLTKCETNGGSNTPFGLFTDNGGNVCLNRATIGGGTPFRVWSSGNLLASNQNYVIAATEVADISVAPKFYVNGAFDSSAAYNLYGGTVASGPPTTNTTSVKVGNRTDLAAQCYHDIYGGIVIKRVLSDGEIAQVSGDLDAIWADPDIEIWVSASGAPATFKPAWARNNNSVISGVAR